MENLAEHKHSLRLHKHDIFTFFRKFYVPCKVAFWGRGKGRTVGQAWGWINVQMGLSQSSFTATVLGNKYWGCFLRKTCLHCFWLIFYTVMALQHVLSFCVWIRISLCIADKSQWALMSPWANDANKWELACWDQDRWHCRIKTLTIL